MFAFGVSSAVTEKNRHSALSQGTLGPQHYGDGKAAETVRGEEANGETPSGQQAPGQRVGFKTEAFRHP